MTDLKKKIKNALKEDLKKRDKRRELQNKINALKDELKIAETELENTDYRFGEETKAMKIFNEIVDEVCKELEEDLG